MKFPSAMFIWPTLCEIVDESNNEEATTNLLFAQLLETIVSNEFSSSCNALKVISSFQYINQNAKSEIENN